MQKELMQKEVKEDYIFTRQKTRPRCGRRDLVFLLRNTTSRTFNFVEAIPDVYAYAVKSIIMTKPNGTDIIYRVEHTLGSIGAIDCFQGVACKSFTTISTSDTSNLLTYSRSTEDDKNWVPEQDINTVEISIKSYEGGNINISNLNWSCAVVFTVWGKI